VISGFLDIYPDQQAKFTREECKCATEQNSVARWAIHSTLSGVRDVKSKRRVQLACGRRRPIRFRITSTSPTPASMRVTELGSGAVTGVKVKLPLAPITKEGAISSTTELVFLVTSLTEKMLANSNKGKETEIEVHWYWSPGRLEESSENEGKVKLPNPTIMVGEGNVTSSAVGGVVQFIVHVKVGVNESA